MSLPIKIDLPSGFEFEVNGLRVDNIGRVHLVIDLSQANYGKDGLYFVDARTEIAIKGNAKDLRRLAYEILQKTDVDK